ncbi:hypothetical protein ACIQF6_35885 [Kitasatospora sp. NPDC092948]|uniref:hypothetical protein n=1 Tax=Kitasatospora sp. NPDC092948 TaxID=3364088 RepID=UPI0037FD167E
MKVFIVDAEALRTGGTAPRGITLRKALARVLRPATGAARSGSPERDADHRALREQLAGVGPLVLTEQLMAEAVRLLQTAGRSSGTTFAELHAARNARELAEQLADPHSEHICATVA